MGTHNQDNYRGLILRDDRFHSSTVTIAPATQQAGPVVGEPVVTDGEGYMDLEAVGTSTAEQKYNIQCVKPGNATGTDRGGRWAWKQQSENATDWRGWFPYNQITIGQVFQLESATRIGCAWPHAITTRDEYVHCVYSQVETGVGASGCIKVSTLNPATNAWTTADVVAEAAGKYGPCTIVELPSGRLLVFVDKDFIQIQSYYSDDRGATWHTAQAENDTSYGNYGIVEPDIASSARRSVVHYQAVYHNGYITLVRQTYGITGGPVYHHEIDHYVSEDFGATWTLVERIQPTLVSVTGSGTSVAAVYDPRLLVDPNGQVMLYYATKAEPASANSRNINVTRKAGPYAKFATNPEFGTNVADFNTGTPAYGRFAVCTDSEGFVALVHQNTHTGSALQTGEARIERTTHRNPQTVITDTRGRGEFFTMSDTGLSDTQWEILSQVGEVAGVGTWAAKTDLINRSTITPYKDGLLLITGSESTNEGNVQSGAAGRGHALQIHLAGTSNYDLQSSPMYYNYLSIDTPTNVAGGHATFSAAGTNTNTTETITTKGVELVSSAGRAQFGFSTGPSMIWAQVQGGTAGTLSGGNLTQKYGSIRLKGTEIRFSKDYAQVFDYTGASPAPNSALLTLADEQRQWLLTYGDSNTPWVMYKAPHDTKWTIVQTNAVSTPGSMGTDATFGNVHLDTYTNYFQSVQFGLTATAANRDWTNANYHPTYLFGRPFSIYDTYMAEGWQLQSKGSAAFIGDTWTAENDYQYPVKAAHPDIAASPRMEWRSLDDDTEITLEYSIAGGVASRPLSPVLGVHLSGINFKTAYLESFGGGSWTTIGTINTATDFDGLKYSLTGNTVKPQASGTYGGSRYVQLEEMADSYAVFDAGGGSETVRRILHNCEGSYSASSGTVHAKPVELEVEGSVAGIASTGNFEIRENAATLIVMDHTTAHTKYRIRIPVQKTAEGYFKIGACVIGPVMVFGQDYSWGRTVELQPNQEITTGRTGDRMVERLGPLRRQVQFAWGEGWDATKTQGTSPTGFDVIDMGVGAAVAVRNDPTSMAGVLRRLQGANEPAVYLSNIPHLNSNTVNIMGKDQSVYGRIVSPVTQTTVLGDEGTNEVITINQIVIDEEV